MLAELFALERRLFIMARYLRQTFLHWLTSSSDMFLKISSRISVGRLSISKRSSTQNELLKLMAHS